MQRFYKTPFFVAEISSNHNQDLNRCLAFIEKAAAIGCDAVKFQLFSIKELFAPTILVNSAEHRKRKAWELPLDFLPILHENCLANDILFGCTPFYLKAVDKLFPYVDFYKIASYELLWNDLLSACAKTGKPIVLSTGMATLDEVKKGVNVLLDNGCHDLTLLHCISGYPTPHTECNLAAIENLKKEIHNLQSLRGADTTGPEAPIRISYGWSDHSVNSGVVFRAVHRWGADLVEFHLDLDGRGDEYSGGHCWLPHQIETVILSVREGFQADGSGKKVPSPSELSDRDWRADPQDGLRPMLNIREKWRK